MIFVTVGTQLPFDRLVSAVDAWAAQRRRDDVLAQVGQSTYEPRAIRTVASLAPAEFQKTFADASLIVAHAGLGTILSALELGKPIIIMPRRAELEEHRNDHQLATANRFAHRQGVGVVHDAEQMSARLNAMESLSAGERIESTASPGLIEAIRGFIAGGELELEPEPETERRSILPVR